MNRSKFILATAIIIATAITIFSCSSSSDEKPEEIIGDGSSSATDSGGGYSGSSGDGSSNGSGEDGNSSATDISSDSSDSGDVSSSSAIDNAGSSASQSGSSNSSSSVGNIAGSSSSSLIGSDIKPDACVAKANFSQYCGGEDWSSIKWNTAPNSAGGCFFVSDIAYLNGSGNYYVNGVMQASGSSFGQKIDEGYYIYAPRNSISSASVTVGKKPACETGAYSLACAATMPSGIEGVPISTTRPTPTLTCGNNYDAFAFNYAGFGWPDWNNPAAGDYSIIATANCGDITLQADCGTIKIVPVTLSCGNILGTEGSAISAPPTLTCSNGFNASGVSYPSIDWNNFVAGASVEVTAACGMKFGLKADCPLTYLSTFIDNRDDKTYKQVTIGSQTWMAENLNYDVPDNDTDMSYAHYGRFYNWATAMSLPPSCNLSSCASHIQSKHQGICPEGWHVPSDAEWRMLIEFVGEASKLKAASGWTSGGNGTDDFGFSALPGGCGFTGSSISGSGSSGGWWGASESAAGAYIFSFGGCIPFKESLNTLRCVQGQGSNSLIVSSSSSIIPSSSSYSPKSYAIECSNGITPEECGGSNEVDLNVSDCVELTINWTNAYHNPEVIAMCKANNLNMSFTTSVNGVEQFSDGYSPLLINLGTVKPGVNKLGILCLDAGGGFDGVNCQFNPK